MSKPLGKDGFEKRIKERFPDEHFDIIKYENTSMPLEIRCCNCNEIIQVNRALNFLAPTKAHGCKNCFGLWKVREQKLNKIKEKYDIIDTFVYDTHTYYTIKCKNCGHERTSSLANLYRHLDCGCATGVYRNRTAEEFLNEVNKNSRKGEFTLLSNYVNQSTKVLIKHDCGFIWEVRPSDIINGRSYCPRCRRKESKGELLISNILNDLNINFQREVIIPDTRQRFDFYFELQNKKFAIEYNGRQHFEPIAFFGGEEEFKTQQERDKRKEKYCEDNSIDLLVIPYWFTETQIKDTIKNKFNDYLGMRVESSDSKQ